MTFEEFLIKKKIDPALLENAEPSLFSEFRNQYDQMGGKSFDHSKKFWFNKLRRSYHLAEVPKPALHSEAVPLTEQAQAPASPPVTGTTGYTPRFKAKITSEAAAPDIIPPEAEPAPKPAYKPRFKAAAPPVQDNPDKKEEAGENAPEPPKPVYKPRFKPKVTKPQNPEE